VTGEGDNSYAFGYCAVSERAPRASGVYTIYTPQRWLYVGESDDIRQSLFQHLNKPEGCLVRRGLLSFSFELVPAVKRPDRHRALITDLAPECPATPSTSRAATSRPDDVR